MLTRALFGVSLLVAAVGLAGDAQEAPEYEVMAALEALRVAEQSLDAEAMSARVAHSLTVVSADARAAGAFAFLEAMRRQRDRDAVVRELSFDDARIAVYGASAVASYTLRKTWVDRGARQSVRGWSTDVFERRDDGAWILVHRHRP